MVRLRQSVHTVKTNRRSFLKKSAAATLAAPLLMSFEEAALARQQRADSSAPTAPASRTTLPTGKIGKARFSRLICGSNLIHGIAHSRDLIYVSPLLEHYFTEEKIMETWALCEQNGIDTMMIHRAETQIIYKKYRARGGRIQFLAHICPSEDDFKTEAQRARDTGAEAGFVHGNLCDHWAREGKVHLIGEAVSNIRAQGLVAGVAAHDLRTVKLVEEAGIAPDFYMKTLHDNNYWSKRQPDQLKEVIDNASKQFGGNYWCMDPKETIAYMAAIKRPWIAYKVLAAGAIEPKAGFRHAFQNGADFVTVGMFDFQIAEDAAVASEVLKTIQSRERAWQS